MEQELIQQLLAALAAAYTKSGVAAAALTFALFATRLYRLPFLQQALPEKARWDSFPKWLRLLLVFVLPLSGTAGLALLGGAGWAAAVAAGIAAGVSAMGLGAATRVAGKRVPEFKSTSAPAQMANASIRLAFPKELQPKPLDADSRD